jgi:hypothetical protein
MLKHQLLPHEYLKGRRSGYFSRPATTTTTSKKETLLLDTVL